MYYYHVYKHVNASILWQMLELMLIGRLPFTCMWDLYFSVQWSVRLLGRKTCTLPEALINMAVFEAFVQLYSCFWSFCATLQLFLKRLCNFIAVFEAFVQLHRWFEASVQLYSCFRKFCANWCHGIECSLTLLSSSLTSIIIKVILALCLVQVCECCQIWQWFLVGGIKLAWAWTIDLLELILNELQPHRLHISLRGQLYVCMRLRYVRAYVHMNVSVIIGCNNCASIAYIARLLCKPIPWNWTWWLRGPAGVSLAGWIKIAWAWATCMYEITVCPCVCAQECKCNNCKSVCTLLYLAHTHKCTVYAHTYVHKCIYMYCELNLQQICPYLSQTYHSIQIFSYLSQKSLQYMRWMHITVTVILFKCPKNKRLHGLPPDIRLSRLHLELPYMQNVLAHGPVVRLHVVES